MARAAAHPDYCFVAQLETHRRPKPSNARTCVRAVPLRGANDPHSWPPINAATPTLIRLPPSPRGCDGLLPASPGSDMSIVRTSSTRPARRSRRSKASLPICAIATKSRAETSCASPRRGRCKSALKVASSRSRRSPTTRSSPSATRPRNAAAASCSQLPTRPRVHENHGQIEGALHLLPAGQRFHAPLVSPRPRAGGDGR